MAELDAASTSSASQKQKCVAGADAVGTDVARDATTCTRAGGASNSSVRVGAHSGFELILLSDLLYECEHEPILRAVADCLAGPSPASKASAASLAGGATGVAATAHGAVGSHLEAEARDSREVARALLTFQVH